MTSKKRFKKLYLMVLIALILAVPAFGRDFWVKNDTADFFFINGTTGYVGIGITNPGAKLDVDGAIRTNLLSCGAALETDSNGNIVCGTDETGSSSSGAGWSNTSTQTYTSLNVNITTGNLTVINGRMGVGTTNPLESLHLTGGDARFDNRLQVGTTTFVANQALRTGGTSVAFEGQYIYGVHSNAEIQLGASQQYRIQAGSSVFDITATNGDDLTLQTTGGGFVGIGTTSPNASLHILGNGTYNAASLDEFQATDSLVFSSEMSNDAYNSILQLVSVRQSLTTGKDSQGYLGFSTVDDSNGQGIRDAGRIAIVNEVGGSRNSATALSFWTNTGGTYDNAAAERVRITSTGNVGIGTTSPSQKLDVNGSINISNTTGKIYTPELCLADNCQTSWPSSSSAGGWTNTTTTTSTTLDVNVDSGDFFVNSTSGRVGIGDTNPDSKLDIYDTVQQTAFTGTTLGIVNIHGTTATGDYSALTFQGSAGYPAAKIGYQQTASGGNLMFGTTNNYGSGITNTAMTIDETGDVGIGTTSPGAKLDVNGTISTNITSCTETLETDASGNIVCGTDDDVPEAGDFAAATDLDLNGQVIDDSHNHIYSNIDSTASSNWASIVTGETGTGNWVFNNAPAFTGETSITGTSTSWGTVPTAGWKTTMGTGASATWLAYGESSNTFRGGIQLLDNGGSMRIYVGSSYISISSAGDLTVSGGDITFGTTAISEANIGIVDDGTITLGTETTGTYVASEADTLATVTGRGATTSTASNFTSIANPGLTVGNGATGYLKVGGSLVYDSGGDLTLDSDSGEVYIPDNVGIGTASPGAMLDVAGTTLTNRESVAYYRNVIHKSGVSSETGTLKITLPKNWSSTMMKIKIEGFEYSGSSRGRSWSVVVGGYNYAAAPGWYNYFAEIDGAARFNSVRLAHNGTNNVILLGTTASSWSYPRVAVTEFMAGHNQITGWDSGWSIDWITNETGIQNVVTPVIDVFRDISGNVGIGTTSPNASLHVAGDINVTSGNDICISGGNCLSTAGGGGGGGWTNTSTTTSTTLDVNVDSGDFFVNSTSGNVGIGTASPGQQLTLTGCIRFDNAGTGDVDVDFCNDDASYNDDGVTLRSITNPATGEPIFRILSSGGSERLRVEHSGALKTTNVIEVDGTGNSYVMGNVGIGATAPDTELHVVGGMCIDTDTVCTDPGAGNALIQGDIDVVGLTNVSGGFVLETRASAPSSPEDGRMWLIV